MQTLRAYGPSRAYGVGSVGASFGEGKKLVNVPSIFLWMTWLGETPQLPNAGIYPTDSAGSLPVQFVVVDTAAPQPAAPLGSVQLQLPLRPHTVWWVTSTIAPSFDRESDQLTRGRPFRFAATALNGGDSLYVTVYGTDRRCGGYLH